MALYGYARVSTGDQSLDRQIDALTGRGVPRELVYEEVASTRARLAVLDRLTEHVMSPGDTLVIDSLDRLARDTARIIVTVDDLVRRGLVVESLYERVDTSTADGTFTTTILGALAQRERDRQRERTQAGLAAAAKRGHRPGRPVAVTPEQHATVLMLRGQGQSYRSIASATGLSPSTVSRICREETPGHASYRVNQETQPVLRG